MRPFSCVKLCPVLLFWLSWNKLHCKSWFLTLSSIEFFLMFRFHLNYRFIYYSSGIEFKSRSFWSGIVQHLVAWNSLYWFECRYIPQLYTSICWIVIKLEKLLVSIVMATILVNLTIHKDAFKIFRGSFFRYGFITLLQTWIV